MPDVSIPEARMKNKTIRIVHIITGLGQGGAEGVLYRLLASQDRTIWQSTVISLTAGGVMAERIRALGVDVRSLDMRPGRVSLPALLRLNRMLREERPDIVQTWMYHANLLGGIAARLAGIRTVFWGLRHASLDPGRDKRSTILVSQAGAWLSGWLPEKIICCSQETYQSHLGYGYAGGKLIMIPNGYDLSLFKPDADAGAELRRELGLDPAVRLIGMVARFHPLKDHAGFIAAAKIVAAQQDDVHFLLCGGEITPDNAALLQWIESAQLADRFHLLGVRGNMPHIYAALDVATLASHGEGFPNVVAESMACGTSTVATDVGDAAEIVGEAGWIVPPGRPEALAEAWKLALALSPEERIDLGNTSRNRVQAHFSIEGMVSRYEEQYRLGLSGSR